MKPNTLNIFGSHTRIDPRKNISFSKVALGQGAQILRVPPGSAIQNLTLKGGASHRSAFASLRGAVLKFDPKRKDPIVLDGRGFTIPTAHTLMDNASYRFTVNNRNQGNEIPHRVIERGNLKLFLVHASYCHPDQLFLPLGIYGTAFFSYSRLEGVRHMEMREGTLFLFEASMPLPGKSYNILDLLPAPPQTIIVQLKEGGQIRLSH